MRQREKGGCDLALDRQSCPAADEQRRAPGNRAGAEALPEQPREEAAGVSAIEGRSEAGRRRCLPEHPTKRFRGRRSGETASDSNGECIGGSREAAGAPTGVSHQRTPEIERETELLRSRGNSPEKGEKRNQHRCFVPSLRTHGWRTEDAIHRRGREMAGAVEIRRPIGTAISPREGRGEEEREKRGHSGVDPPERSDGGGKLAEAWQRDEAEGGAAIESLI